jgi:acetyl esterase/lipase
MKSPSRKRHRIGILILGFVLTLLSSEALYAQIVTSSRWLKEYHQRYNAALNIPYKGTDTPWCRLDCYSLKDSTKRTPVIVWIHGGGWRRGTKDSSNGLIPRFMDMGWAAVNVNYRVTEAGLAPAAVADCRAALAWVESHAEEYYFDPSKIVVGGTSAGGHLALMTGMLPAGNTIDSAGGYAVSRPPAAILDFYGITDVADLLSGPNRKGYAVSWIGNQTEGGRMAALVSPMSYVRSEVPPVFIAHGDKDTTVPYTHALRLKHALDSANVRNALHTVEGGYHGKWGKETDDLVFGEVVEFLKKLGW